MPGHDASRRMPYIAGDPVSEAGEEASPIPRASEAERHIATAAFSPAAPPGSPCRNPPERTRRRNDGRRHRTVPARPLPRRTRSSRIAGADRRRSGAGLGRRADRRRRSAKVAAPAPPLSRRSCLNRSRASASPSRRIHRRVRCFASRRKVPAANRHRPPRRSPPAATSSSRRVRRWRGDADGRLWRLQCRCRFPHGAGPPSPPADDATAVWRALASERDPRRWRVRHLLRRRADACPDASPEGRRAAPSRRHRTRKPMGRSHRRRRVGA